MLYWRIKRSLSHVTIYNKPWLVWSTSWWCFKFDRLAPTNRITAPNSTCYNIMCNKKLRNTYMQKLEKITVKIRKLNDNLKSRNCTFRSGKCKCWKVGARSLSLNVCTPVHATQNPVLGSVNARNLHDKLWIKKM